jgi:hypothetical protein
MSAPRFPVLQTRIDDFSFQVSSPADPRFWFRVERSGDSDVITDYFLGSFPKESGGDLLEECYRVLGLTPRMVIVFRDILPSSGLAARAQTLAEARDLYADCGKTLLLAFGALRVHDYLEEEQGRYNLVLTWKS